jgi:hypothetical protein
VGAVAAGAVVAATTTRAFSEEQCVACAVAEVFRRWEWNGGEVPPADRVDATYCWESTVS